MRDADRASGDGVDKDANVTDMRDRLIVGLDVPTLGEAEAVVKELDGIVSFYKIGYQLAFVGGLAFARELAGGGRKTAGSRTSCSVATRSSGGFLRSPMSARVVGRMP